MDFVLNRIIAIEKEARQITEKAMQERENIPKEIEDEVSKIEDSFKKRNDKLAAEYAAKRSAETTQAAAELKTQYNAKSGMMKESFEIHEGKWAKELFEDIIKG